MSGEAMNRAYSVIAIKSIDEDARTIEGVASSITPDRVGDIVEPRGAKFGLPLPLLWQHKHDSPVGHVTAAETSDGDIRVRAQIARIDEPGELQTLTDRAWQSVKSGLVRGLSIGFRPLSSPEKIAGTSGVRFKAWEWLELSLVTIPANADATIAVVKQYDEGAPAASGTAAPSKTRPGASGKPVKATYQPPKAKGQMTIKEQIGQFEATRAAKAARMDELMKGAASNGETLNEQQEQEYDDLAVEVAAVDKHLVRLRTMEQTNKAAAVPVAATVTSDSATMRPVITVKPNVEKGIGFARQAMALIACQGNKHEAAQYAEMTWPDQPEVALNLKAAVAAGNTTNATWAGPLAQPTPLANEFLDLLRPATVLGRVAGLKRVPFNISLPSQTAGGTYSWIGQGVPTKVTKADFATVTLGIAKAAGIIVLTEELVRNSSPAAQGLVRDEMVAGMARYLDAQFLDPAVAEVANVSPASITNGVAGTAASGVTEAAARADLRALLAGFPAGNYGLGSVVLLMAEGVAFTLGTMVNALGQTAFPGLTATGGTLLGLPVVTSNTLGTQIVAAHAPSILFADEGGVELDISREASLQFDDEPDNPVLATTVLQSLWQMNMVGLKAVRFVNWKKARATAVRRIHTVAYT
jgi:HK97 family phage major capsid protein/HK97 family phage prohead protease